MRRQNTQCSRINLAGFGADTPHHTVRTRTRFFTKKGSGTFLFIEVYRSNRTVNKQRQGITMMVVPCLLILSYPRFRSADRKLYWGFQAFEVLMNHQSFFSAVRAKKLARTAPEMLCHTENTAPGMVASGYCAKWAAAREVARPEFCIPTSMEIARHLVESSFSSLPTPKPVR